MLIPVDCSHGLGTSITTIFEQVQLSSGDAKKNMCWGNGFCRHCGQIGKPRKERPPKGNGGKGKTW